MAANHNSLSWLIWACCTCWLTHNRYIPKSITIQDIRVSPASFPSSPPWCEGQDQSKLTRKRRSASPERCQHVLEVPGMLLHPILEWRGWRLHPIRGLHHQNMEECLDVYFETITENQEDSLLLRGLHQLTSYLYLNWYGSRPNYLWIHLFLDCDKSKKMNTISAKPSSTNIVEVSILRCWPVQNLEAGFQMQWTSYNVRTIATVGLLMQKILQHTNTYQQWQNKTIICHCYQDEPIGGGYYSCLVLVIT